ncbi:macro domain-containing protein [Chloroflexota bacterium]
MIIDNPGLPWIWVRKASALDRFEGIGLTDWIDFTEKGGAWVIIAPKERLDELAAKLDPLVESDVIPDVKYSKRAGAYGPLPSMKVFCYECDRDRVWNILAGMGITEKRWRSEKETLMGFAPGGRHYIEIHGGERVGTKVNGKTVEIFERDINWMEVDVIVNAITPDLKLGVGLSGEVARMGGSKIQEELDRIGGGSVGDAVITTGGELRAKYVIHTIAPRMGEGNEDEKLRYAMLNSLKLADEYGLKSIAFPAISGGRFGFPLDRCARVMLSVVIPYLKGDTGIERLVFCIFGKENFEVCHRELQAQQS